MASELLPRRCLRKADEYRECSGQEESRYHGVDNPAVVCIEHDRCGTVIPRTYASLRRFCTAVFLMLTVTLLSSLKSTAQSSPFVADTLVPPHLFDLNADGSLYDFGITGSSALSFVYRYNGNLSNYNYLIRHNIHNADIDTLYEAASTPSTSDVDIFHYFDTKEQIITLGYGYIGGGYGSLVTSSDAGKTWESVDIKEQNCQMYSLFYGDLEIVKPGSWLVESYSPTWGWLYVTRDKVFPLATREWDQYSWVQLFDDDSILVFAADYRPSIVYNCKGTYAPDTALFETVMYGQVADRLTPIIVPSYPRPPLPFESECPIMRFIGSDGERLWFNREWHYQYPAKDGPSAFPTVLYSYNFTTGAVQYEHFFSFPRQPLLALIFAGQMFVVLDSQLVFRHLNGPPGSPFTPVPGVEVGLENLQVHDGTLYGSHASGLIMRIRQTSSVPTSGDANAVSFSVESHGEEIEVVSLRGATSGNVRVELFDALGRRLAESRITAGGSSGRLPTPSAPGVYFVRCAGSETAATLRIVVPAR